MTKIAEILKDHYGQHVVGAEKTKYRCVSLVTEFYCGFASESYEEHLEHVAAVLHMNGIGDEGEAYKRGFNMGRSQNPRINPDYPNGCICNQPWNAVVGRTCPVHGWIAPMQVTSGNTTDTVQWNKDGQ